MIYRSVILLGLWTLAAGITFYKKDSVLISTHLEPKIREKRAVPYRGPPAPLNRDGTVALTPEIQQLNSIHNAAYAQEFERLRAAADLAAAHPDRTSPPSPDYNPNNNGQYDAQTYNVRPVSDGHSSQQLYNPIPYNQQQYTPTTYTQATAYNPALNNQQYSPVPVFNNQGTYYNQQQFAPSSNNAAPYNQQLANPTASEPGYYNQGTPYNQQIQVPAPLNPDGTAAQTAEFKALAASLQAAYQQALSRPR